MACCTNCGALLTGPYCAECGQRVEPRIQPLSRFLGEAFDTVTNIDSRLWRTFVPLLFRPGWLTREFLQGRRASYVPPFKLYFVITLLFFLLVATLAMTDSAPLLAITDTAGDPVAERARANTEFAELEKRVRAAKTPAERAVLQRGMRIVDAARAGVETPAAERADRCQFEAAPWIEPRLEAACRKVMADQGRGLGAKFVENVPNAMFLFLPFLALVMKAMYRRPRRYYVVHLLFLIHNHAFAFLFFSFFLLSSRLVPAAAAGPVATAAFAYLFWYFFRSMRRVYAEGRARTFAKFAVLGFMYLLSGAVMVLLTAFVSAVSL